MAEAKKTVGKKVWSGYECPACFGVFRVPKGNEHREAICPRCETILHLVDAPDFEVAGAELPTGQSIAERRPPQGASSPELESPTPPQDGAGVSEIGASGGKLVRKRRKKIKSSLDPDWERTSHARKRNSSWKLPVYLIVGAVPLLLLILVGMRFLNAKKAPAPEPRSLGGVLGLDDEPVTALPDVPEFAAMDVEEESALIFAQVRKFMAAESAEEMLEMVRGGAEMKEKIRLYYEKHLYQPVALSALGEDGSISTSRGLVSINVTLDDFTVRQIALEKVDGRYLVDWESWVGYSKTEWESFLKMNPRRGKEFRVVVSPVDYYNFDFADDAYWKSFRITAANEDGVVYGYLPRSSPLIGKLSPLDPSGQSAAFVLKLRYPLETKTANQVLIENVICSGWVLPIVAE